LEGKIQPQVVALGSAFLRNFPEYISQSLTVLIMVPFLSFFMLTDGRNFIRNVISMSPNSAFELTLSLHHQISSQLGGFIRARLLESIIVGALIWIGLLIMNFPYALILAIFGAVLNIIPYVGPVLGALPAFVIVVSHGGSASEHLMLASIYFGVQVIDTVVLVPFLVARIVNLHPVTVVLSIILGSQFLGILGMIICIPVVSTLKVTSVALYKHFTDFRA
jgi:putative permease